jgi:hypothetical protein
VIRHASFPFNSTFPLEKEKKRGGKGKRKGRRGEQRKRKK